MVLRMLWMLLLVCVCLPYLPRTVAQASDDGVKLVISPQGPLLKPIGENMFLRCQLDPESAKGAVINIRWLNPKGDLIGVSSQEGDRLYSQSQPDSALNQLYIMRLQREDGGDYKCVAEFPGHNPLSSTITIDVFQDVQFEDAEETQNPVSGTDGKIKCVVSGNPAPEVDWLRDGQQFAMSDRYKVDTDGLEIKDINQEDDGEYTCRAVVGSTGRLNQRKIKVEVYSIPEFVAGGEPKDVRGNEGQTVSFACGVKGRPGPQIQWVFANGPYNLAQIGEDVLKLQDEQRTLHHTIDPVTGTMTINDLQKRDQGEYKCIARNPAGFMEKSASLYVVERPRFDVLTNVTESEGNTATLHCSVRGDPAPKLHFIKEGSLAPFTVGGDPRIRVVENERDLKVIISKLQRSDDGLYICIASNEAFTEEKSSHITVKFKPSFRNTPMHVAKTWMGNLEPVNLTCIAESIPNATIRWEKQQRSELHGAPFLLITENTPNIKVEQRGPSSSILITPKVYEDYGVYECIASNELGEARHMITLHQATFPGPLSRVNFTVVTATSINFNLEGPDEPNNLDLMGYEVYYHEAGGSMSDASSRYWPIGVPYTVDHLKPSHRYFFRFHARNKVGLSIESRDFERVMPDIGPPRPPGYIAPTNDTLDGNRYRLQWLEPADNGARILDYQVKYWKDGEKDRPQTKSVPAPASSTFLTGLQPSTRYNIEITARNERGIGPALDYTFSTANAQSVSSKLDADYYSAMMTTPLIAGIAVGVLIILLVLIDLCCYCSARRGLTAFICQRVCGQSKSLKDEMDLEKNRTGDEANHGQEKSSSFIRIIGPSSPGNGNSLNGGYSYSNGTHLRQSNDNHSSRDSQIGVTRTSSMGSLQQLETDV